MLWHARDQFLLNRERGEREREMGTNDLLQKAAKYDVQAEHINNIWSNYHVNCSSLTLSTSSGATSVVVEADDDDDDDEVLIALAIRWWSVVNSLLS